MDQEQLKAKNTSQRTHAQTHDEKHKLASELPYSRGVLNIRYGKCRHRNGL